MSRIAYAASKKDFIYDFDTNVFMTKMCEGAALNRIGGSYSEKKSWEANAGKVRSLLSLAVVPDDVQVARIADGYCRKWTEYPLKNGDLARNVQIGDWSMPWETNQGRAKGEFSKLYAPSAELWASHPPMGINQAGCIFSAQGCFAVKIQKQVEKKSN